MNDTRGNNKDTSPMNENNNDTPGTMEAAMIEVAVYYESKLEKKQEENDRQLAIHISTIEQQDHQIRQLRLQLEEQRIRNNSLLERINELSMTGVSLRINTLTGSGAGGEASTPDNNNVNNDDKADAVIDAAISMATSPSPFTNRQLDDEMARFDLNAAVTTQATDPNNEVDELKPAAIGKEEEEMPKKNHDVADDEYEAMEVDSDSDGVLGMNKKQTAAKKKKTATTTAAVPDSNNDTSFSSMSNPCCILVKSYFGKVETVEMLSSGSITVREVKQSLVQKQFIREEEIDVINLIDARTRRLLENSEAIENFQCVHKLYAVFGTDPKYTGADSVNYFHAPSFNPVAAATSVAGDANSTIDDEVKNIPSHFEVTGIFTSTGGYQRCNNLSEFRVPKGCQVLYLQTFIVPPQLTDRIGTIDGGREFANLLLIAKIGESMSFDDAMDKFMKKRTYVCFARQQFVLILHQHNSIDMESSLHLHFAMKKGNAQGEFYSIKELDIHDVIEHFESFPDVKLVFGTTTYPGCQFGEMTQAGPTPKPGSIYRVGYEFNEEQKRVINELENEHGKEDYATPFTDITCNVGDLCRALLAKKVGRVSEDDDESVFVYLRKLLWANGTVSDLEVNTIRSSDTVLDERSVHNRLGVSNHINGEWFLRRACPNPSSPIYDPLFDHQESTIVSSVPNTCKWFTKNHLQRFIDIYGTLSYELAWQLIVSGAIVYHPDRDNDDSELTEFEQELLKYVHPADKTPTRRKVLEDFLKTNLLGDGHNRMNDTAIEAAFIKVAQWGRCIKLILGNSDTFVAISNDAAIDAFVAIFGESKRNIALGFIQ